MTVFNVGLLRRNPTKGLVGCAQRLQVFERPVNMLLKRKVAELGAGLFSLLKVGPDLFIFLDSFETCCSRLKS